MGNPQANRALNRAAFRLAGWQITLTTVVAVAAALLTMQGGRGAPASWSGFWSAFWSAMAGGGIGVLAGLYQALRMFRMNPADGPERFLRAVYAGEAMKIMLTAALFIVVIRVLHPQFGPMIIAYGATFLAYWAALGTGYPWLPPPAGDAGPRRSGAEAADDNGN